MSRRSVLPRLGALAGSAAHGKPLVKRPRPPAAFRVPDRGHLARAFPAQSPQLFVHEGARQAIERRLKSAFPGPVVLSITDNRHSIVSHTKSGGVLRVRLHHMFLDAPPQVVRALVRYITRGDRQASIRVGQYIDVNGDRLDRRARRLNLVTKGKRHDLLSIFDDLNERYFGGAVHALVTWGKSRPRRRRPRLTIKLGSYSAAERLIRVHPVLDRKWVPRYFVGFIVYHEMLHHMLPASRGALRRMLHPREFREREREFWYFERAVAWERGHIGRLLRS
jgi:hypothetical protein